MRRLKEQLLPAFGVFPCLAFLDPFFSTSKSLQWISGAGHFDSEDLMDIAPLLCALASLLYLSWVTDRCADSEAEASERLVMLILRTRSDDQEWQQVCRDARELALVPHEVCRGFPLSVSSFCSFLGAVITITALGLPMMQKMMKAMFDEWMKELDNNSTTALHNSTSP